MSKVRSHRRCDGRIESEVYDASKEILDAKGIEIKEGEIPQGKVSMRGQSTTNILLEGAAWNFINIRRTAKQHNLPSEASFRFSRGVHPALAETGVKRGLQLMSQWSNGNIAPGLVDEYPLKPKDPTVTITPKDVKRLLGIDLTAKQIADSLERLEFKCTVEKNEVKAKVPPHRMDIGTGVVGLRMCSKKLRGFMAMIAFHPRPWQMHCRLKLGIRFTNGKNDCAICLSHLASTKWLPIVSHPSKAKRGWASPAITFASPIRSRRNGVCCAAVCIASVLDVMEHNIRLGESLAFFEIGSIFEPNQKRFPNEPRRLAIAMSGLREATAWDVKDSNAFDFYDMKGRIELLLSGLRYTNISYSATDSVKYLHPGKAAEIRINEQFVGVFGELHPLVKEKYEFGDLPMLVAEFDLETLRAIESNLWHHARP